jgi:pSer/pThr/pTyr-binding forkhead associated (FHA) protein
LDDSGSASPIPVSVPDAPLPISTPPIVAVPTTPQQAVAQAVAGKPRLEAVVSGQTFVLVKDENAVGRRSPVDGIFPEVDLTEADVDSYISRRHGKIIMGEQGPVYEDLGSSNGSFHNGTRLQQGVQAVLREGDRLRLGKTEMIYHSH